MTSLALPLQTAAVSALGQCLPSIFCAWDQDVPWDGLPEAEASGMMAQEASGRAPKRRRGAWWRCGSAKGSVPA